MDNEELPTVAEARMIAERFGAHAFRGNNGAARENRPPAKYAEHPLVVRGVAEPLERQTIDSIAELLRTLTYGEVIELSEGLWDVRPQTDLSKDSLPALLHRWAMSRKD